MVFTKQLMMMKQEFGHAESMDINIITKTHLWTRSET